MVANGRLVLALTVSAIFLLLGLFIATTPDPSLTAFQVSHQTHTQAFINGTTVQTTIEVFQNFTTEQIVIFWAAYLLLIAFLDGLIFFIED